MAYFSRDYGHPNWIDMDAEFYVDYNPFSTNAYGSNTTVIVIGNMENFFILNGDHRENLKDLSLVDCLEYFEANQQQMNTFSEELPKPFDLHANPPPE